MLRFNQVEKGTTAHKPILFNVLVPTLNYDQALNVNVIKSCEKYWTIAKPCHDARGNWVINS